MDNRDNLISDGIDVNPTGSESDTEEAVPSSEKREDAKNNSDNEAAHMINGISTGSEVMENESPVDIAYENIEGLLGQNNEAPDIEASDIFVQTQPSEDYENDTSLVTNFDLFGSIDSLDTDSDSEEADCDTDNSEISEDVEGQLSMDFSESSDAEIEATSSPSQTKTITKKHSAYDPEHPRRIDTVFDFMELFIFALVAVLIFTTFFFRISTVDGASMESTLYNGERLIISNVFYEAERGDIIVCEDYSTSLRKPIVKRVIAIAGDHIEVSSAGYVTLNGEPLEEDYVYIDGYVYQPGIDMIVPDGKVFVMGDHRNMSTDSREIGAIDTDSIIGKVILRFYPFDKFGKVE